MLHIFLIAFSFFPEFKKHGKVFNATLSIVEQLDPVFV
jgi:hypothetical protein